MRLILFTYPRKPSSYDICCVRGFTFESGLVGGTFTVKGGAGPLTVEFRLLILGRPAVCAQVRCGKTIQDCNLCLGPLVFVSFTGGVF